MAVMLISKCDKILSLITCIFLIKCITSQQDTTDFPFLFSTTMDDENIISYNQPDCQCISGWSVDIDIHCSLESAQSNINTLQAYLTSNHINCYKNCDTNIECQQSYSLLTQYYQYCSLGAVSEEIIRSFRQNSTCIECTENVKYHNETDQECSAFLSTQLQHNCSTPSIISGVVASIDYVNQSCAQIRHTNITSSIGDISTNNTTIEPTMSPTQSPTSMECTTDCQNNWDNIASYQRQCNGYQHQIDYALLDELYHDTYSDCNKDCNLPFNDQYTANCSTTNNIDVSFENKLDIISIQQQAFLCFYGLNIDDPTNYDLICIERVNVNSSGIISYKELQNTTNKDYWGSFGNAYDMNLMWLVLTGAMVFFMQTGFTLLESGVVKAGNVQSIMFKNMMDAAICAISYWIVGYCVAYGDPTSPDANGFIGVENVLIESETWADWFFHMAFACTASTIVSGAVAERLRMEPYFIYTIVISCWIYPVVVHWIWSETGWLSPFNTTETGPVIYGGAIDFAGSSVVHMIGGICALCGAYFVGPRLRRFDTSKEATSSRYYQELMHQFEFGHNVPFQVIGLLILWFGFYGFNCGSTLKAQFSMDVASLIAVNTTLSAAAGGLTSAIMARTLTKSWHIPKLVNGILAALASITASCAVVSNWWAIFIGIVGSCLYYLASHLMVHESIQIDDPLDAFAVHGIGGSWGVLSAAFFSTSESLKFANYPSSLYNDTTKGERVLTNILLLIVVIGWALFWGGLLFGSMNLLKILRVSEKEERVGIDIKQHGGSAINMKKTYATSVIQTTRTLKDSDNKNKTYHHPFHKLSKREDRDYDNKSSGDDYDSIDRPNDGEFDKKVKESSLEKRLNGIAESDEDVM